MIETEHGMVRSDEIFLRVHAIEDMSAAELGKVVQNLIQYAKDDDLHDAYQRGLHFASIREFTEYKHRLEVHASSKSRKRELASARRKEFASLRAMIELRLIERDGYVCADLDCNQTSDLTIDHIEPLSKGGSDELENLRFLCRSHNSSKGDRSTKG